MDLRNDVEELIKNNENSEISRSQYASILLLQLQKELSEDDIKVLKLDDIIQK